MSARTSGGKAINTVASESYPNLFTAGITVTVSLDLKAGISVDEARGRLAARYEREPLVQLAEGELPPMVTRPTPATCEIFCATTVEAAS